MCGAWWRVAACGVRGWGGGDGGGGGATLRAGPLCYLSAASPLPLLLPLRYLRAASLLHLAPEAGPEGGGQLAVRVVDGEVEARVGGGVAERACEDVEEDILAAYSRPISADLGGSRVEMQRRTCTRPTRSAESQTARGAPGRGRAASGSEAAGQQGAAQALWRRTPQPGGKRAAGSARQARALQPALAAQRRSDGGAPVGRITGALGGKV